MTLFKKYLTLCSFGAVALLAQAKPNVLAISEHMNDSTIVYPESFETDTHKMMQNWYLQTYTALDKDADSRPDVTTSDEEIIHRLQSIPTTIEMPFNSIVRAYIDTYTGKKRALVETMLGMSLYYMPIFEEALEREGLPIELKYLPIIESALDPDAVSKAGAVGLWQIMLQTARGLGLEISTLVDERRDPIRASEAAVKYLHQLYDIYKDWSLAIAAYNCGPGNINKALRRAGDDAKDFWAIYPYLPQETRGYLPSFIAATYVMNYYNKHNISPALAKRPIVTDSVHVTQRVHFQQIADVLQIPVEEIQILNPQYRKQEIPGDIHPYSLVLPANQTCSYILSEKAIVEHDAELYARREVVEPATGLEPKTATVNGQEGEWVTQDSVKYHKVRKGETMSSIAKKYGVTLASLKKANGNISKVQRGKTLKVVTTTRVFKPFETQPTDAAEETIAAVETPEAVDAAEVAEAAAVANDVESAEAEKAAETTEAAKAAETAEVAENTASAQSEAQPEAQPEHDAATQAKVAGSFRASKAKQAEAEKAEAAAETAATAKASTTAKSSKSSKSTAKAAATKTHTVRSGESLFKIAKANGTTVAELKRLNGMKTDKLKPGDKIRVK